jgi:hypothetical protein
MAQFSDLAEHTGTLIVIIGFIVSVCGILIGAVYKITFTIMENLKQDLFDMINKLDGKIGDVWEEISKIRDKQTVLREELPKEYIRVDGEGYKALLNGINRIETHFEQFVRDCKDGKCRITRG